MDNLRGTGAEGGRILRHVSNLVGQPQRIVERGSAIEKHFTLHGEHPQDGADQGGLAGTIRTDQSDFLPGRHQQVHSAQGQH